MVPHGGGGTARQALIWARQARPVWMLRRCYHRGSGGLGVEEEPAAGSATGRTGSWHPRCARRAASAAGGEEAADLGLVGIERERAPELRQRARLVAAAEVGEPGGGMGERVSGDELRGAREVGERRFAEPLREPVAAAQQAQPRLVRPRSHGTVEQREAARRRALPPVDRGAVERALDPVGEAARERLDQQGVGAVAPAGAGGRGGGGEEQVAQVPLRRGEAGIAGERLLESGAGLGGAAELAQQQSLVVERAGGAGGRGAGSEGRRGAGA